MKRSLFIACMLLSATRLFAQPAATGAQPRTTPPGAVPQTVTMTGCVAGQGSDAQPFILNNPVVVPSSGATAPGAVGSTASAAGAQPPTVAPTPPPVSPPSLPPAVTPTLPPAATPTPPSSAATSGSAGAAGTVGTAGTAATATPGAAASGGTAAAISGYRLSGSDMKPWTGQRVEIVGSMVTRDAGVASGAGVSPPMPEFRVQSVRPVGGPCPQQ
jgi:hypothetical protein